MDISFHGSMPEGRRVYCLAGRSRPLEIRAALTHSTVTKNLVTVIAHVVDRSLQLALALKAALIGYRTRQAAQFKTVSLQPGADDSQTVLADARRPLDRPIVQPGHFLRRNHRLCKQQTQGILLPRRQIRRNGFAASRWLTGRRVGHGFGDFQHQRNNTKRIRSWHSIQIDNRRQPTSKSRPGKRFIPDIHIAFRYIEIGVAAPLTYAHQVYRLINKIVPSPCFPN